MFMTRIGRMLARFITPPARSSVSRSRLACEALETREVPATFSWLGMYNGDNAGTANNWTQSTSAPWVRSSTLPGANDDLRFDSAVSSRSAFNLGAGTSSYKSISVVNNYSGQIQTYSSLTYQDFTLDAPSAVYNPQSDQTVADEFTWTRGNLGGNGPTMWLTGRTATITPGTGTNGVLQSGMGLRFASAVSATISTGTLEFMSSRTITLSDSSILRTLNTLVRGIRTPDAIRLLPGQSETFYADHTETNLGLLVEGGKAFMQGGGAVKFNGTARTWGTGQQMAVSMSEGALVIENGTTLEVPSTKWVEVLNGNLASMPKNIPGPQPAAVIKADRLVVVDGVVTVSDGRYAPHVVGHRFATLRVEAAIDWQGGIYAPYVDPAAGATAADVWESTSLFLTGTRAQVVPVSDAAAVGNEYTIMKATLGFVESGRPGDPMPALNDNWHWKNSAFGAKEWKIKRGRLE